MKELKNYVANQAQEVLLIHTGNWQIGLYEHKTAGMLIYCVARKAATLTEPSFDFYLNKEDAIKRLNDIYNIVKENI